MSSSTKIMMSGPVVCQLREERSKETNRTLKMLFFILSYIFFFSLLKCYAGKWSGDI